MRRKSNAHLNHSLRRGGSYPSMQGLSKHFKTENSLWSAGIFARRIKEHFALD